MVNDPPKRRDDLRRVRDRRWCSARTTWRPWSKSACASTTQRTFPLIEYYKSRARVRAIDGNRPQDVVFQDLLAAVEVRA